MREKYNPPHHALLHLYTLAHFILAFVAMDVVVKGGAGMNQATRCLFLLLLHLLLTLFLLLFLFLLLSLLLLLCSSQPAGDSLHPVDPD